MKNPWLFYCESLNFRYVKCVYKICTVTLSILPCYKSITHSIIFFQNCCNCSLNPKGCRALSCQVIPDLYNPYELNRLSFVLHPDLHRLTFIVTVLRFSCGIFILTPSFRKEYSSLSFSIF